MKNYNRDFNLTELDKKFVPSKGNYLAVCPLCKKEKEATWRYSNGYHKMKLSILPNLYSGYCFRCNTTFITTDEKVLADHSKNYVEEVEVKKFELPAIKYGADIVKDSEALNYLISRSSYYKDINFDDYNIFPIKNKILIKYYFGNIEYYYQLRYISGNLRYYNPPTDTKPLYIVKGEFNPSKPTIISEGVFGSLAIKLAYPNFNSIALLGSYISNYQLEFLKYLTPLNKLYIMCDTCNISFGVRDSMKKYFSPKVIKTSTDSTKKGIDPEEFLNYVGMEKFKLFIDSYIN